MGCTSSSPNYGGGYGGRGYGHGGGGGGTGISRVQRRPVAQFNSIGPTSSGVSIGTRVATNGQGEARRAGTRKSTLATPPRKLPQKTRKNRPSEGIERKRGRYSRKCSSRETTIQDLDIHQCLNKFQVRKFPPLAIDIRSTEEFDTLHLHRSIPLPLFPEDIGSSSLKEILRRTYEDAQIVFTRRSSSQDVIFLTRTGSEEEYQMIAYLVGLMVEQELEHTYYFVTGR